MIIINALQGVFTVFFLIAVGFILSYKMWFDEKTSQLFSKLVINIALPAFMISNLTTNYNKEKLAQIGWGFLMPLVSMVITYSIAILISMLLKIKKEQRGIFHIAFALSNTIFIGLPVNVSLFGEESVPFVLLYYICNTTFFWTIGVYEIRKYAGTNSGSIFSLDNLKKILNPPIISFLVTIIVILLDIHLPKFLLEGCKYLGNLTTPLSTLFIGIVLSSLKLKDLTINREVIIVLLGRFIVTPAITALLLINLNIPYLMKQVFIIEAAMPVMTQAAIAAKAYDGDHKYAAVLGTISTAVSLIFIPIYMIIFSYFKF